MNNFDLSDFALKCICPNNELIYDDKGMPSVMVKIPKMTLAQLGMGESTDPHPAFVVNGIEKDAIWISKYQNIVQNGRAYSLPGQDPKASITMDSAIAACIAKGAGHHMMTNAEWGLMVRICQKLGSFPKGNNNYGKDSTESFYKAIPTYISSGQTNRVATGTGPVTWAHDGSLSGIFDLKGNVWEWVGGMRTVYGELQIMANNDAAIITTNHSASSPAWKAIDATSGALITPNGSGTTENSIKLDWVSSKLTYSTSITDAAPGEHSCTFANIVCNSSISEAAKLVLQELGLLQYGSSAELFSGNNNYFNNAQAERCFYRGGYWGHSSYGLASFYGYARSSSGTYIGFRSAYYET